MRDEEPKMKKGNPLMKGIIALVVVFVLVVAYVSWVEDWRDPLRALQPEATPVEVTIQVDSSLIRRSGDLRAKKDTSLQAVSRHLLVAQMDSDSVRVSLHRPLQEVVTIDMEEHKEHVFFTLEDIKVYFSTAVETYKNYKAKKNNNDHH